MLNVKKTKVNEYSVVMVCCIRYLHLTEDAPAQNLLLKNVRYYDNIFP